MIARRPRPHVDVIGPALLIGLGAIALLFTSGLLRPDAAYRLLQLWPLVLVLVGVQIVAVHLLSGRAGALAALVAMLGVIALGAALALSAAAGPVTTYRAPVGGATAGTLRLDAGPATVRLARRDLGGDLYQAVVRPGAYAKGWADVSSGSVRVAVAPGAVDLALDTAVPWAVNINGAGLGGEIDLTGLHPSGFSMNGVGSRLDLRLPVEPRGVVTITANGVGMDLTVRVPEGTAVRAVATGLATGLEVNGTRVSASMWSRPGLDAAAGHYEIRVTGVASHVRLETMP